MSKRGKRYTALLEKAPGDQRLSVPDAVENLLQLKSAKFDETVELALKLGIDAKQADQLVRGSYSLPKGSGKNVTVIAFCEGDVAEQAKAAGAAEAGGEELAKKIEDGWVGFDVAIAHPSMMRHVGKLGRVLGPINKMPSPKNGTVTPDVVDAVTQFVAGKIQYRNDSFGNVNVPVGKASFSKEDLIENIEAFLQHIVAIRPSAVKGTYLDKAAVSLTMSPGIRLAV